MNVWLAKRPLRPLLLLDLLEAGVLPFRLVEKRLQVAADGGDAVRSETIDHGVWKPRIGVHYSLDGDFAVSDRGETPGVVQVLDAEKSRVTRKCVRGRGEIDQHGLRRNILCDLCPDQKLPRRKRPRIREAEQMR